MYTDGACRDNPGPGGWAWAVPGGEYRSGADPATTNQRMEIRAVLEAVTALEGDLEVVSDSTYVVNCFRDRWWEGWIRRNWTNSQRKPVANADLWRPLIEEYRAAPQRLHFRWVKGHAVDPYNDLVDRLAVEAAMTQKGRRGHGQPTDLPSADALSRAGRTGRASREESDAAPAPNGFLIAVTGLRPPDLGGYEDNVIADATRNKLAEILAAQAQLHPDLVVCTGMGLGAETLAAEAAGAAGLPYVAVLPYPDMDRLWPSHTRKHFAELLAGARDVLTLQRVPPQSRQRAGAALTRRDQWLARHAAQAIVVWDGKDSSVDRTLRLFQERLGDDVWLLEPVQR